MQTCRCPSCGAELPISDPTRKQLFCRRCGTKIKLESSSAASNEVDSNEAEIKRLQQELEIERLKHQQEMERLKHQQERLRYEAELTKERSQKEDEAFFSRYEVILSDDPDGIPVDNFLSGNYASHTPKEDASHNFGYLLGRFFKKHPYISVLLVCALLSQCGGSSSTSSNSTSKSSSTASSTSSQVSTSLPSDSYLSTAEYVYDSAYCLKTKDNTYYFMFDFQDAVVCFVSTYAGYSSYWKLTSSNLDECVDLVSYLHDGTSYKRSVRAIEAGSLKQLIYTETDGDEYVLEQDVIANGKALMETLAGPYDFSVPAETRSEST